MPRPNFFELDEFESLIQAFGSAARLKVYGEVKNRGQTFPLYSISIGSPDPEAPSIGFFAGCHGLERIGSEVVLSYLRSLLELSRWDKNFQARLKTSRLVFMPMVNPVGIFNRTRSNGNGVDLIRNSPVEADPPGGPFYRGHRFSNKLPYFRGTEGQLEPETAALIEAVQSELLTSKISVAVDVHSGFGAKDRFWFPYAHSHKPFPHLAEAYQIKALLDQTYPHHFYEFEPMSTQYTIHGDPWDYLFLENAKLAKPNFFLPFTLEMGSWAWLKKNPTQIFSAVGVFDPVLPHRRKRVLRRHLSLFDFLHRIVLSPEAWRHQSEAARLLNDERALKLWFK